MSSHHPQDQGSPSMVSPPLLAPLFTSPLLPTSSPEAMHDTDTIPSASLPLSTASTRMPASSETSLPSIINDRQDSSISLADRLRRPSASSIRSHPSILRHNDTPPRPSRPNGPSSPNPNSPSVFAPSPKLSSTHRLSYKTPASPEQQRRNSQDRRVRSEGTSLGQSAHRPSFIGTKNPSVLTGGYDTSDSDSQSAKENDARKPPPTFPLTASASFHGVNPAHLVVQERRRRAQSLMSPLQDEYSPSGDGSGSGKSSIKDRRTGGRNLRLDNIPGSAMRRDRSGSRSSRLSESVTATQSNRRNSLMNQTSNQAALSPNQTRPVAHSPLASAMQSRTPSTYFRETHAESSRHASFAKDLPQGHSVEGSAGNAHDLPARNREVERLRREEGVITPSPEPSKKGKEKAREIPRSNGLASTLGLAPGKDSQPIMNAAQINAILVNSDVGAALLQLQEGNRPSTLLAGTSPAARRKSISQHSPERTKSNGMYMPTAPAPLIQDDNPHRDRTVSISSTIGPTRSRPTHKSSWDDEAEIARRRREARRRSSTLGDGEGGHVPFTHHVPTRVNEAQESSGDESADNDNDAVEDRPPSSMLVADNTHLKPPSETSKEDGKKRKKGRFSGLFHRRKKSTESLSREFTTPGRPIPSPASHTSRDLRDHAQSRELYLKDLEIRTIERERREEEDREERLYQARLLVQAHPASSRRTDRVVSHFRAYYNQVYDSIENPPRLNPPSILRWKKATLEQNENREKWKAEQAERQKDPTSFPSAWTQVYNSPNSIGSAAHLRPTVSRDSQPMSLGTSGTAANLRASISTHGATHSDGRHRPGSGWHYTVDDIVAYKEAKGKVDYFMPPVQPPTILTASMNKSQTSQSNKLDDFRPELENREVDLNSSLGSNGRRGGPTPRITSASMVSVAGTASPSSSHAHLARTTSNETSSKVPMSPIRASRKLGHRPHQSMSAVHGSTTNLANMVKAPFHRLKEAKRQLTTPYISGSLLNGSESAIEESPSIKHVRPRTSANTPMNRTPIELQRSHWPARRGTPNLTDEERTDGPDQHGRTFLAIKGALNNIPHLSGWHRKHDEVDSGPQSAKSRTEEVEAWTEIADREKRMGIAHQRRRPTILAMTAEDHLAQYAAEEYGERSRFISAARGRADILSSALEEADHWMMTFVQDIAQIENTSKIRTEIDLDFPGLEELRVRYNPITRRHDDGQLTPPNIRSPTASRRGSRRFTTLNPPTSPALYIGTKFPRRSVLDAHGNRVDPIRQVELALDGAREKEVELANDRHEAIVRLRNMARKLEDMVRQKNNVRDWLDRSNQVIRKKQDQVANMERQLTAGFAWTDLLGPYGDRVADFALRYPGRFTVAAIGYPFRLLVYLPGLWWEAGIVGKVFGGIVSVLVLVIGISWAS